MSTTFQISDTKTVSLQPLVLNQTYLEVGRLNYSSNTALTILENTTLTTIQRSSNRLLYDYDSPLTLIPITSGYLYQPPGTKWVSSDIQSTLSCNWSESGQGATLYMYKKYITTKVYTIKLNPLVVKWGTIYNFTTKDFFEKSNDNVQQSQNKISLPSLKGFYEQTTTPDILYKTVAFPSIGNITWKPENSSMEYNLNQLTQLYPNITFQHTNVTTISTANSLSISFNTTLNKLLISANGNTNYGLKDRFIMKNFNSNEDGIITLYDLQGNKVLEWEIPLSITALSSSKYTMLEIDYLSTPIQQTLYDKLISIFPQ